MKRTRSVFVLVAISVAAGLGSTACIPGDIGLEILYSLDTPDCVAVPGGVMQAQGVLDVGATNASLMSGFWVRNNLGNDKAPKAGRLNTRDLIIDRAIMEYTAEEQELQALMEGIGRRESRLGVTVQAASDAGLFVEVIPRNVAAVLVASPALSDPNARATVIANIRMVGTTAGGIELESVPLPYRVEVCNRCFFCPGGTEPLAWGCSPGSPSTVPGGPAVQCLAAP